MSYYFYQIDQEQTVKFSIVSIQRRVIDRAADTKVTHRLVAPTKSRISVVPTAIRADNVSRLKLEEADRISTAAVAKNEFASVSALSAAGFATAAVQPMSAATREAALKAVDEDLISAGLLDKTTRKLNSEVKQELSFETTTFIPTPGLLVRGCLDDCDICEPELKAAINLDLERKQLENELLKRKIELMDQAAEYRCCPAGEKEEDSE